MLGDIARFLLNTVFTLFGAALLLRVWLQAVRMSPYNPVSQGVYHATNWLVLPLRKIIPGIRGIDWACIFAAWLSALVYVVLMVVVGGGDPMVLMPIGLVIALLAMIKWALYLLLWATLLMALLSWINPNSPSMGILMQLTAPFLDPLRRVMPHMGGFDFSPLVLLVIVQILLMVVTRATVSVAFYGV